jgi:hypothetical protein
MVQNKIGLIVCEINFKSKKMKRMKWIIVSAALLFATGILPVLSQVVEEITSPGITHRGDSPYLLESGWIQLLNGKNMDGWMYVPDSLSDNPGQGGWTATPAVIWDESNESKPLKGAYISGDRIVNTIEAPNTVASDIVSVRKFGDMEIYLEFLVANKSNSGVYVHGLYEIQILSSYGKDPGSSGLPVGSIYDYHKQVNGKWVGGVRPLVRAERPSGQWQSLHIHFQAPRFDSEGNKISNARFIRVLLNGILIHENVERKAMTRSGMMMPEAPENPAMMLQGNHGPIAYRNIYVRPLTAPSVEQ